MCTNNSLLCCICFRLDEHVSILSHSGEKSWCYLIYFPSLFFWEIYPSTVLLFKNMNNVTMCVWKLNPQVSVLIVTDTCWFSYECQVSDVLCDRNDSKLIRPSVKSDSWNMETVFMCGRGVNLNPHIWSQNLWLKLRLWKLPIKKSAAWILWLKLRRLIEILQSFITPIKKEIKGVSGILWLNF